MLGNGDVHGVREGNPQARGSQTKGFKDIDINEVVMQNTMCVFTDCTKV